MNIITVCHGGNIRSVGMAEVLKYGFNHNAVALSIEKNTPEPLGIMCEWADLILVVTASIRPQIPEKYHHKTKVAEVGPDVFGNSRHPALKKLVIGALKSVDLI